MDYTARGMIYLTVLIAIWVIAGLICGFVCKSQAARKGYSAVGFFCLGFFLNVIGLVVALVLPAKQSQAAANADSLLKYKELLDNGAITQEEFEAKKRELL